MVRYYIKVKRLEEDEFKEQEQCIEAGSVWQLEELNSADLHGGENDKPTLRNITRQENFEERFKEIDSHSYEVLLAIPKVEKRLQVFEDASWLREGHTIQVGSEVVVFKEGAAKFWGVVRFIGKLPKFFGYWFGVELDKSFPGQGSSNGKFKGVEYFRCPPDTALFVTIGRLRLMPSGCMFSEIEGLQDFEFTAATNKYNRQTSPAASMGESVGLESLTSLPGGFLNLGEAVVWPTDTGSFEYGKVRWIGVLPNSKVGDVTVGVEFINPVGQGNGTYKKRRLFNSKPRHAMLLSAAGLIRAADFDGIDPNESIPKTAEHSFENLDVTHVSSSVPDDDLTSCSVRGAEWERNQQCSSSTRPSLVMQESQYIADPVSEGAAGLVPAVSSLEQLDIMDVSRSDPVSNNECVDLRSAEEPVISGNSSRQSSVQANASEYPFDRPSEQVKGKVPVPRVEDVLSYCGRGRGIQGCPVRQTSTSACVTESIVFALFLFFDYFDEALYSPSRVVDPGVVEEQTEQLRQQLVVEIVNPLRRDKFVSADKIERFNSVFRFFLMAEKESYNPVELLNKVFTDVLRLEHFISFTSGESYYVYEIKDIDNIVHSAHTRNVQHLLECAIINGNHRLRKIPDYLIISLSAAGGNVVYPSFTLETTDLVEHIDRICNVCGFYAEIECCDCYRDDGSKTLADALFCRSCFKKFHTNITRSGHRRSRELNPKRHVSDVASEEQCIDMELFAVICNPGADALRFIAYVCVGPCGYTVGSSDIEKANKWLVYDGMAKGGKAREGGRGDGEGGGGSREEAGGSDVSSGSGRVYIPEIRHCPEIDQHCFPDIGVSRRIKVFEEYPKTLQTMMTGMSVCFYRRVQRIANMTQK